MYKQLKQPAVTSKTTRLASFHCESQQRKAAAVVNRKHCAPLIHPRKNKQPATVRTATQWRVSAAGGLMVRQCLRSPDASWSNERPPVTEAEATAARPVIVHTG